MCYSFYILEYPAVSIRFSENDMCVNPFFSVLPPPQFTRLVLRYNCLTLDAFFIITANQNIQHIASGLYVHGYVDKFVAALPARDGDNPPTGSLENDNDDSHFASSNVADDGALDDSDIYGNTHLDNTAGDTGSHGDSELVNAGVGNGKLSADTGYTPSIIGTPSGNGVLKNKAVGKSYGDKNRPLNGENGDGFTVINGEPVTDDNIGKENKILGHASREKLDGMNERLAPRISVHSHVGHTLLRRKKRGVSRKNDQKVNLYLRPMSNLKFLFTSDPKNYHETSDENGGDVVPQRARHLHFRNVRQLAGELFKRRDEFPETNNKRVLVTDVKSYLQENETGLCIGYRNKDVILMPCESVPSSVQFYGECFVSVITSSLQSSTSYFLFR